jgi:Domain of unknown function (DUF4124)
MEAFFYAHHSYPSNLGIVAQQAGLAYALLMKFLYLLLCCVVMTAQADVYRWVDKNGNVIFSDQPHPGAEKIEIETLPSYTPVAIPEPVNEEQQEEGDQEVPRYKVTILTPANDETIRNNAGLVNINAKVTPPLDQDRNDQLTIKLDGQTLGEPSTSPNFTLSEVERGTHTVQVVVVDKDKKAIKSSKKITFHLQRVSAPRKAPR